jgi:CHASE2 domain-containing sensor protein
MKLKTHGFRLVEILRLPLWLPLLLMLLPVLILLLLGLTLMALLRSAYGLFHKMGHLPVAPILLRMLVRLYNYRVTDRTGANGV